MTFNRILRIANRLLRSWQRYSATVLLIVVIIKCTENHQKNLTHCHKCRLQLLHLLITFINDTDWKASKRGNYRGITCRLSADQGSSCPDEKWGIVVSRVPELCAKVAVRVTLIRTVKNSHSEINLYPYPLCSYFPLEI